MLVQTALVDKISWYRAFIQKERDMNSKVTSTTISTLIVKYYAEAGIRPPSNLSVKSHVMAVLNLKDAGLAALKDVTHLSGRKPDDRDLTYQLYSRVSLNSLLRKKFKAFSNRRATSLHLPHDSGSRIQGHGLFTSKNLDSTYAGMPAERSFRIYNSTDQLLGAVKGDGVPRYAIGDTDTLQKLCALHEAVREGAVLCLRPDPSNPWLYANSSANTGVEANIVSGVLIRKVRVQTPTDALELLSEASNVAVFKVVSQVVKGTELIFYYPMIENDASVDDQDDDEMSDPQCLRR